MILPCRDEGTAGHDAAVDHSTGLQPDDEFIGQRIVHPRVDQPTGPQPADPSVGRQPPANHRPIGYQPVTTIAGAIRDGAARLLSIADNPRLEARLLLAHALNVGQTDLLRDLHRLVDTDVYDSLLARRQAREPIALILGYREFWSMEFLVSGATLIPRPDTETVIEAALTVFAHRPGPRRILDLGTGTGCLLLALLREFPEAYGIGVDITPSAAFLGRCNGSRFGMADRAAFICGDWTNPLNGRFDLVVSNPPYVAAPDLVTLMPEVAHYELRRALDGGADGYDAYREILPRLRDCLAPGGAAVLELGFGQANAIAAMAHACGLEAALRLDLGGIARAIVVFQQVD